LVVNVMVASVESAHCEHPETNTQLALHGNHPGSGAFNRN
jgi:hypothetical protein